MGDEEEKEEEPAFVYTLEEQFVLFSKHGDSDNMRNESDGSTITLFRSDYWMRQAKVLEDRQVTMTNTGMAFYKFG